MVVLTTFSPPEEGIVHKQETVEAHITGKGCLGSGTLFIAERQVVKRANTRFLVTRLGRVRRVT